PTRVDSLQSPAPPLKEIAIWISKGRLRISNGGCVTSPNLCNQAGIQNATFAELSACSWSILHRFDREQEPDDEPNAPLPNNRELLVQNRRRPYAQVAQWRSGDAIAPNCNVFRIGSRSNYISA